MARTRSAYWLLTTVYCLLLRRLARRPSARDAGSGFEESVEDAPGRVPVPQRRDARRLLLSIPRQNLLGLRDDARGVCADDAVRAQLDRHGALRVLPERQARDAERRRLLLYAARVRQHEARAAVEPQEVEVAQRLDEAHARRARLRQPELFEVLPRA